MHASVPGPVTLKGSDLASASEGPPSFCASHGKFSSVLLCIWAPKGLVIGLVIGFVLLNKTFRVIVQKPGS